MEPPGSQAVNGENKPQPNSSGRNWSTRLHSISIKGLVPFGPGDGVRDVLAWMDDCINIVVPLRDGLQERGGLQLLTPNKVLLAVYLRGKDQGTMIGKIFPVPPISKTGVF